MALLLEHPSLKSSLLHFVLDNVDFGLLGRLLFEGDLEWSVRMKRSDVYESVSKEDAEITELLTEKASSVLSSLDLF